MAMATCRQDGTVGRDFAWLPTEVRTGHEFIAAVALLWHSVLRWGYGADEANYESNGLKGTLQ
jgi:hypothetical protein